MFETTFKNIDDRLHKDPGCSSELDYVEQSSWILFLKYLSELEKDKRDEAALQGKEYTEILSPEYSWDTWACPKDASGKIDHNKSMTGDDLIEFVNQKLFPYLKKLNVAGVDSNSIQGKISIVFEELRNKLQSGYTLRDVLDEVDKLKFRSNKDKHEMSHLYETKIKNMGNAGRNGGEYYTPRPLIRAMVEVVNPQVGETVYDGAVGSAGFLCEAFEHMSTKELTAKDLETLKSKTFYGKELKSLAYIIGIMNMILHGIESPNIQHINTLAQNINDIQEKDRFDVILANPPFGGKIRSEIQQNFPIKSGETAYLFLQHFIKSLKSGGRGAIVIKNTFLSNSDNASISLRKYLLESCDLHTVLDMPSGTFQGAGVKTVVLFFTKGKPTRNIWYYELSPSRSLGKTNPLNDTDLADFVEMQKIKAESVNSWSVEIDKINQASYELSANNPNKIAVPDLRDPKTIIHDIRKLDNENETALNIKIDHVREAGWKLKKLKEVIKIQNGYAFDSKLFSTTEGTPLIRIRDIKNGFGTKTNYTGPYDKKYEVKKGDLLIGMDGEFGCYQWKGEMALLNQRVCRLQEFDGTLNPKYLLYTINKHLKAIEDVTAFATVKHISSRQILDIEILLPSLSEQERIVGILDNAFENISQIKANTQKKLSDLDELRESVLKKVLEGEQVNGKEG